jgi:hypothetical protein
MDVDYNPIDKVVVWKSMGGYANHLAERANLDRLYKVRPLLPNPDGELSDELSTEGIDDEETISDAHGEEEASE